MIDIACKAAVTASGLPAVPPLTLGTKAVEEYYRIGSNDDIRMTLQSVSLQAPELRDVDDFDLHERLAKLTNNPFAGPVRTIGVLFAGSYTPDPAAFGIMFDPGFNPTASSFDAVGREGCAVFLDRILAKRGPGAAFADQVVYTTIHELGHVFNLFHIQNEANFMASSKSTPPVPGSFQFTSSHQSLLKQCSTSPKIQPGGSKWGDLGGLVSSPTDPSREDGASDAFGLELRIDVDLKEFWFFEPVELEVELRVGRGVRRTSFRVPDVIDPGYEAFTIWIEDPFGERHRYRRTKLYCPHQRLRTVTADRPFRRDITLFGQSGGYTFPAAGIHRIWAVLNDPRLGQMRSNTVEVNVLPIGEQPDALADALRPPQLAKLLFYRSRAQVREAEELEQRMQPINALASGAAARYTVGRVYLKSDDTHLRARGIEHLARAAQHDHLSRCRRETAEKLLADSMKPKRKRT